MKVEAPKEEIVEETILESIEDDIITFEGYEALEEPKDEHEVIEYYEEEVSQVDDEQFTVVEDEMLLQNVEFAPMIFEEIPEIDGTTSYSCTKCPYIFEDVHGAAENQQQRIKQHSLDHEDGKYHVCMDCSELFKNQTQLKKHQNHHRNGLKLKIKTINDSSAKKIFKCYICDGKFCHFDLSSKLNSLSYILIYS